MILSILVISRTSDLLNKLLLSIDKATNLKKDQVEIICSWNGSKINEQKIVNRSGYDFKISQRKKYNFAKNMNSLAKKASGEILLIINDDIVLDPNTIDYGMNSLNSNSKIGIVTGKLRFENGLMQHMGISFGMNNNPYHKFKKLINSNSDLIPRNQQVVSGTTGALLFIKKDLFLDIGFNENYKVCGEDIELSLDIRERDLDILFCPDISGVHLSSETRRKNNQYGNTLSDIKRMQKRRLKFLNQASKRQLLLELNDLQSEIVLFKELQKMRKIKNLIKFFLKSMRKKILYF